MTQDELGPQPLDAIMVRLNISNADLVGASTEQLTFKMVQKGRKGRRLTINIQMKILRAIGRLRPGQSFELTQLFNY